MSEADNDGLDEISSGVVNSLFRGEEDVDNANIDETIHILVKNLVSVLGYFKLDYDKDRVVDNVTVIIDDNVVEITRDRDLKLIKSKNDRSN